jgi:hypothetical protein
MLASILSRPCERNKEKKDAARKITFCSLGDRDNFGPMFRIAGRAITVLSLCCAIGLHWIALQSIAWTTMIIDYSKGAPLRQAITQTFNGSHPCSICHLVNKGTNSEKKSDLQPLTPKIDIICTKREITLLRPFVHFEYLAGDFSFSEIGDSPPVPPPRSLLS